MFRHAISLGLICFVLHSGTARASTLGDVRGSVRDPQSRAVVGARVVLHSTTSEFSAASTTDHAGDFSFRAVSAGEYSVTIDTAGFSSAEQQVTVTTGTAPLLEFTLSVAPLSQSVEVVAAPSPERPAPTSLVSRDEIRRTPGADQTNSLAMIVDYVPGAYVTHDQLHIRGGHQVSWLIDGVPVPNSNIASNVGPQVDPKDVDVLEAQRGGYSAEYGDRTYAVFNVVPRTGFERSREGELVASFGTFHQTNDQISFGDHTKDFAYYGSLTGYRTDFGLATPGPAVLHDQSAGVGGFASLVYLPTAADQLRAVVSARGDHYQVPNDPEAQEAGIRDVDREADSFVNLTWAHTFAHGLLLTASPFYHFNRADYVGGEADTPLVPRERRSSHYGGAQVTLSVLSTRHSGQVGFYGFAQRDDALFGLRANDGSGLSLEEAVKPSGDLEAYFVEDQYKPNSWLTLTGGLRVTRFSGEQTEHAVTPRAGAAIRIPRVDVVLRGFYGRYYQAPPLATVSGPVEELAIEEGLGFLPLAGERDEEYQAGVYVPIRGWSVDANFFHTHVRNFFDHEALGESNIFFPLTIDGARIRGFELAARSPRLFARGSLHVAYSRQKAEGFGGVTGGLTDFEPPEEGVFFLDHDQRHTLSVGGDVVLPRSSYAAMDVRYGSGFLDGEGPDHLPGHTVVDVSLGKSFGESWSVAVHGLNVANRRFLLDNSETFGGTHYADPRQIFVEARYRFHF